MFSLFIQETTLLPLSKVTSRMNFCKSHARKCFLRSIIYIYIMLYYIVLYYIITSSLFRSDMSKPKDFYWGSLGRSINEIKLHAKGSKFSCAHQPLVNIPLQNVVLDELHLMLRITGQCLHIIITWVTMRLHIPKLL